MKRRYAAGAACFVNPPQNRPPVPLALSLSPLAGRGDANA
jgi:hypothetical protein